MNYINKYIITIVILVSVFACEEPGPIEISNLSDEEVEVSIVQSDPNSYVITGYDSTGIIDEKPTAASVISISGIKNTIGNATIYKGYGEAIFFDISQPVQNLENKLIGYKTLNFRSVTFNDQKAIIEPLRIRYRENITLKDTLLGVKHSISYRRVLTPQNHDFPYNGQMNVKIFDQDELSNELNLKLPDEIIGKVELTNDKLKRNQNLILTWNNNLINSLTDTDYSDEIIVGGINKIRDELIPLIKFKRFRSNQLEIKNSLLQEVLSSGKFEYIVITFIRKIRKTNTTNRLGEIHFAAQSIHNIWIKI
jgi:hypothetical protein